MLFKKIIYCLVTFLIVFYSFLQVMAVRIALAQDSAVESSPVESPSPTPEPANEPIAVEVPIPVGTPTPPPLTSPEYDIWRVQHELDKKMAKAEKRREKDLIEARQDEWDAHEEDEVWTTAHGNDVNAFVSGEWQKQQDNILAEAAKTASAPQAKGLALLNPCSAVGGPPPGGDVSVTNENCLALDNISMDEVTTGQNVQLANDGGVSLLTGQASATQTLLNTSNSNVTNNKAEGQSKAAANDSFAQGESVEAMSKGDDSENFAQGTTQDSLSVQNTNDAFVDNKMATAVVSGENDIIDNDGAAKIKTGDVDVVANLLNLLNINMSGEDFVHMIVNAVGNVSHDIALDGVGALASSGLDVIAKTQSGPDDSKNTSISSKEVTNDIANTNNAQVKNDLSVEAVSGSNFAIKNDGAVDLDTGSVSVLANLLNFINSNSSGDNWSFMMVNVLGNLTGNLIAPGVNQFLNASGPKAVAEASAGEDGTGVASATTDITTRVDNTNDVTIANNINVAGISGQNEENKNDNGIATTTTGEVKTSAKLMDLLNLDITGNNWVFVVVSVFGKWMGKIVGLGEQVNAPEGGVYTNYLKGNGGDLGPAVVAQAKGEGDSENSATASYTEKTNVTNTNKATIENNIDILGVSGRNKVNQNEGAAKLNTGYVDLGANLMNMVNTNFTGNNWMVVVLNVFGDFLGNVIFGQQSYIASNEQVSNSPKNPAITDVIQANQASTDPVNRPTPTPSNPPTSFTQNNTLAFWDESEDNPDQRSTVLTFTSQNQDSEAHDPNLFEKLLSLVNGIIISIKGLFITSLANMNTLPGRGVNS